jgi:hypothetical protein
MAKIRASRRDGVMEWRRWRFVFGGVFGAFLIVIVVVVVVAVVGFFFFRFDRVGEGGVAGEIIVVVVAVVADGIGRGRRDQRIEMAFAADAAAVGGVGVRVSVGGGSSVFGKSHTPLCRRAAGAAEDRRSLAPLWGCRADRLLFFF